MQFGHCFVCFVVWPKLCPHFSPLPFFWGRPGQERTIKRSHAYAHVSIMWNNRWIYVNMFNYTLLYGFWSSFFSWHMRLHNFVTLMYIYSLNYVKHLHCFHGNTGRYVYILHCALAFGVFQGTQFSEFVSLAREKIRFPNQSLYVTYVWDSPTLPM